MSETLENDKVTRATFAETLQPRIGGNTTDLIISGLALKSKNHDGKENDARETDLNFIEVPSALLSSTPPTVSKSLVKLYPYLIIWDRILGILTWTGPDIWPSLLLVFIYLTAVLYIHTITKYFGHVIIVSILLGYSILDKYIENALIANPTVEDIIFVMDRVSLKSDILLAPLTNLRSQDLFRLLSTIVLLSPIHLIITGFLLPPQRFLLMCGLFLLTYHSPWSKVTRRLLWKFRFVRLLVFYLTGLDLGGIHNNKSLLATVQKQVNKLATSTDGKNIDVDKPIRFTYVLYENQRHWIGIGWKGSMLSYERTPWTDEFLNEAPSPENFKLPEDSSGMIWKWVDKTWRLDLTNDGAISVPSSKPKTIADPDDKQGFIYYDNSWKKPSADESFSKYTRRRRWVRTAELIKVSNIPENGPSSEISVSPQLDSHKSGSNSKRLSSSSFAGPIQEEGEKADEESPEKLNTPIEAVSNTNSQEYESIAKTNLRKRLIGGDNEDSAI